MLYILTSVWVVRTPNAISLHQKWSKAINNYNFYSWEHMATYLTHQNMLHTGCDKLRGGNKREHIMRKAVTLAQTHEHTLIIMRSYFKKIRMEKFRPWLNFKFI